MDDEDDVTPLRRSGRRRTKRFVSASDGEEEVEIVDKKLRPFAPPAGKKRGRGRSPTTGEYVGRAKTRENLIRLEREELQLQADGELMDGWTECRQTRSMRVLLDLPEDPKKRRR
ncbi:gag-like protein [Lasius niger]|uniref:Gag-like protein n=1 Tax=Lasius niger TaxID=67767 RepID=A0A0J7K8D4_LASNI|nr:gag-like protein [Lasius niger]